MTTGSNNYLSEFTLTPSSTARLRAFFDANSLTSLKRQGTNSHAELQSELRETLPEGTIESLSDVLEGKRDSIVAIHGFPEVEGLEHLPRSSVTCASAYSYHIGNALYALLGKHNTGDNLLFRQAGELAENTLVIHRDTALRGPQKELSRYIIFSSPHNAENAATEFIHLKEALASIPPELRHNIRLVTKQRYMSFTGEVLCDSFVRSTAEEVLRSLERSVSNLGERITQNVRLESDVTSPEGCAFLEAIATHRLKYTLHPGTLLVVNEDTLFHRGHFGDIQSIKKPMRWTRLLIHNSGAPRAL